MLPEPLTKNERSALLYAECCAVDHGGLMQGARMNEEDHEILKKMHEQGYLVWFGRLHSSLLGRPGLEQYTHFVILSNKGHQLAAACRKLRAQTRGTTATLQYEMLVEDGKITHQESAA